MKKINLFFTLFLSVFVFSQVHFEKGFFINNADVKTECLIKNVGWRNSPTFFEYKTDETSEIKKADIKEVKEFEIGDQIKFVRKTLNIDQSSNLVNKLSFKYDPEFMEKTVFLFQLVDGKAKLYKYEDGSYEKFFIAMDDQETKQLIYKQYEYKNEKEVGVIGYNNDYKKELQKLLTCSNLSPKDFTNLEYKENSLRKLFSSYNQCENPAYKNQIKEQRKGFLNISLRPRINSSVLKAGNEVYAAGYRFEMERKTSFGIGLEFEYVLPFNKNKWSIIFEPTYRTYKAEEVSNNIPNYFYKASGIYESIELPIGFRHFLFLNNESKLFVNAQYAFEVILKNKFDFKGADGKSNYTLESGSNGNYALGVGYNFKKKYGVEVRYFTNKNIFKQYVFYTAKYQNLSLIFSYNFL